MEALGLVSLIPLPLVPQVSTGMEVLVSVLQQQLVLQDNTGIRRLAEEQGTAKA